MRNDRGTSYTAEIETPSGLAFYAEVYVPPEAEYADQHELVDVVNAGAARMVGMAARVPTSTDDEAWAATVQPAPARCGAVWEDVGVHLVCAKPEHGYSELHRTAAGLQWIEPLPF